MTVSKYEPGRQLWYSFLWFLGTITFIIPLYYSIQANYRLINSYRIKKFIAKNEYMKEIQENDIRDFCLSELSLCYIGIEIDSMRFKIKHSHQHNSNSPTHSHNKNHRRNSHRNSHGGQKNARPSTFGNQNQNQIINNDLNNNNNNGEGELKTFVDLLDCCVWFQKVNLCKAKKVKIDLYKLSILFNQINTFKLYSVLDLNLGESLCQYQSVDKVYIQKGIDKNKNIHIQHHYNNGNVSGNGTKHGAIYDYAKDLHQICEKHVHIIIDIMFKDQLTLLHKACLLGDDKTVRLLIEHKANIEAKDSVRVTDCVFIFRLYNQHTYPYIYMFNYMKLTRRQNKTIYFLF